MVLGLVASELHGPWFNSELGFLLVQFYIFPGFVPPLKCNKWSVLASVNCSLV